MNRAAPAPLRRRRVASAIGLSLLAVYVLWNVWWVAHARVPPSLLKAITGLPAPTTGTTRSCLALLEGDLSSSLYYNPMTMAIAVLLAITIYQVARRRFVTPWIGRAWPALLFVAWIIKLASPRDSW